MAFQIKWHLPHNRGKNELPFRSPLRAELQFVRQDMLEKAIWFDQASGQFTSSKAYFDAIPNWLACFNRHIGLDRPYVWHKAWPKNRCAYNFKHINNYDYAKEPPLVDTIITKTSGKNPYETLLKTPRANQVLLNLALTCVKAHMTRYGNEQLLLWVCIGSLDKIGHDYGPDSLEAIDLIIILISSFICL